MSNRGKKIVLAASTSESSEYLSSTWRQMLLGTLPSRYSRFPFYMIDVDWRNETLSDGQAVAVPNGLRVVESLLLEKFSPDDVVVCYPDQLDLFVGEDTRVVGVHAHNPLGITFATDVYVHFYGKKTEPINAAEFKRLITHPAIKKHKNHLKVIVGGPGSWQIEKKNLQDEWGIDCIVEGEAEDLVVDLFERALRGESLPRRIEGQSPAMEHIPTTKNRSTFGVVEITRGCGRGCQFCSIALRKGRSLPLEHILENVRVQVANGAETITITTEDLFLYEQGPKFETNVPALKKMLKSITEVPGVKNIMLTHGTISPIVRNPELLEELSPYAVGSSIHTHPASTHPDKRYASLFVGLETGSTRLFNQFMKGKAYPYKAEQWHDVVLKGMELMNRHNWFPFATFIVGLPGETEDDTKRSLDLLHALKDSKWVVIPTLFVPLEDTRMEAKESAKLAKLTELQWEFFFTCWRYNIDFYRSDPSFQRRFNLGIPIYYYMMGRRLFGKQMKYPLLRLAHFPESYLSRRLYLNLDEPSRMKVPEAVEIPQPKMRPAIPELVD
ncbi:MAG: B12-binding domain-containing radical SAM protein [Acidobacteria bacterium]|nr:B12-binding domain-containing radical SAM protein [Acidobacteriota bacterium]